MFRSARRKQACPYQTISIEPPEQSDYTSLRMISRTTGHPPQSTQLSAHLTAGAQVKQTTSDRWHLEIPPGPQGSYRLAQLDDYTHRSRQYFPWKAPLSLTF